MIPSIIQGKVVEFIADESYYNLLTTQNPFRPQLPREEKITPPQPVPVVPVKVEPPVLRPTPVPPPPQPAPVVPPPRPIEVPRRPEVVSPPMMTISGLIWNSGRPQAIINNQIVDVGDMILNAKITAIHAEGVDILFLGQTFTIKP